MQLQLYAVWKSNEMIYVTLRYDCRDYKKIWINLLYSNVYDKNNASFLLVFLCNIFRKRELSQTSNYETF